MKKIALAVLLASGLMATDSGFYVGADVGNTAMDGDIIMYIPDYSYNDSTTIEDDGGSQTLKVGYYFDKNNRASAFFQNVNVDGGDSRTFGVGYDYLIGDNNFKPFIGLIVGSGNMESDDGSVSITGVVYGAQLGLNYAFNENFSAEIGYRYLKSNMEDSISGEIDGTAYTEEVTIDTVKNWFVGVNYKF
jgi:opacity protein-like surface antigen